jgi:type I restriction enzyme S subunit
MSRIDDLIAEHCPDGVEFRPLDGVARIRNGRDYKTLGAGTIPVYGSGGIMTTVDTAVHPGPSVLIPRKGSLGNLFYVDEPFWTVDTIFYTEVDARQILPKFLYYFVRTLRLAETQYLITLTEVRSGDAKVTDDRSRPGSGWPAGRNARPSRRCSAFTAYPSSRAPLRPFRATTAARCPASSGRGDRDVPQVAPLLDSSSGTRWPSELEQG